MKRATLSANQTTDSEKATHTYNDCHEVEQTSVNSTENEISNDDQLNKDVYN